MAASEHIEGPRGDDVVGWRADNPSPLTLEGTNSWFIGRDPTWLIDPGPDLAAHLDALEAEVIRRGGLGGVLLTHDHPDHADAVAPLARRLGGGLRVISGRGDRWTGAAGAGHPDVRWEPARDGERHGPVEVLALPGHAPDHVVFLSARGIAFSGDAVLGAGSVFIAPDPGALSGYLAGLERLARRAPVLIAPGHGPRVDDPAAKLAAYREHRLGRETALEAALAAGGRTVEELLDAAWSDVPGALRFAAAITLAAHLDRLEELGRLPAGVQRPPWPPPGLAHPQ